MSNPDDEPVYDGPEGDDAERTGAAEAMPDPVDVVDAKTAAARAPAARAVAAGPAADETDRITCMICGAELQYPKFLVDAIRRWNRAEYELAQRTERDAFPHQAELISNRQIGCCDGACSLEYRAQLERDAQQRLATTDAAWKSMREGRLSPAEAEWLRAQGYPRDVEDYYARQAASGSAQTRNPPAAAPADPPAAHDRQLELD